MLTGSNKIAIINVALLNGRDNSIIEKQDIYIEGQVIKEICNSGSINFGEDVLKLNHTGKTIMPGIIDCHVHICADPLQDTISGIAGKSDTELAIRAASNLKKLLFNGVTYVRGMGDPRNIDIELSNIIKRGKLQGPEILPAGEHICMTGGHGWVFGTEADGALEVRKAVRTHVKEGAKHIKMMATGGVMTPNIKSTSTQFTYEELKAGVEEAYNAGVKTSVHAQGNQGIRNAVLAGVDSIEHGFYMDEEIIEWMVEKGTYYVPTLCAPYFIIQNSKKVRPYVIEKAREGASAHVESFKLAVKNGVKIALGTDAGTPFNEFGSARKELMLMIEAGMTPKDAIKCATSNAADLLGISDEYGTLENGKMADLIILEKNPLIAPETIMEPIDVFKRGQRVIE